MNSEIFLGRHVSLKIAAPAVNAWPPLFFLRENLSRTIDAAGQRLVGAGCVIVAAGGRPRGIGGQIQGQQHRRHRTAKSHQGNTGVRAAHRWGGDTHTAQSAQSSVICCFLTPKACPECESLNSSLYGLLPTWCLTRIIVRACLDLHFYASLHG